MSPTTAEGHDIRRNSIENTVEEQMARSWLVAGLTVPLLIYGQFIVVTVLE